MSAAHYFGIAGNSLTDGQALRANSSLFRTARNDTGRENTVPQYFSPTYQATGTVLHSIVLVLGLFGNCLIILAVVKNKYLRTPVNYHLVSLATADILVLLSSIPDTISSYFRPAHVWVLGQIGCSSLIYLQYFGINASSASMLAFSVERYLALCRPRIIQDPQMEISKVRLVIISIWVGVGLYCSPWIFLTQTSPLNFHDPAGEYRDAMRCHFRFLTEPLAYAMVFVSDLLLFYVVPLLICLYLYVRMAMVVFRSIRRPSRSLQQREDQVLSSPSCDDNYELRRHSNQNRLFSRNEYNDSDSRFRKIIQARIQVAKMLGLVVLLFAVLSLPYRGLMVYNWFATTPWLNIWYVLFARTCIFLNSSINPLLYDLMVRAST
ncbi:hypothetical protein RvY_15773 [Ramazzottius varieornatus]|uniref:Thyrotropin-releasing hormone receptor n=1 Tax=Ramazzottius varieornatus TaxID=947166 RepID=A0A1D1VW39_RAMVA|nr:hypothetical protein RvY_15773 [Ramazzottius varieornatus]